MKPIFILILSFISIAVYAQSNNCSTATPIAVNATCSYTAGTTTGATASISGCTGNADDDVWYSFTANNTQQTITLVPLAGMDPVVQLFSGSCGTLLSLYCQDDGFSGDQEEIIATGLTVGSTYYIRVYDYWSGSGSGNFNICVQGYNLATVTNDDACSAIDLGPVTQECNYQHFTTAGATTSTPNVTAGCTNSGDSKGGWGAGTRDVWFKVTVPTSGKIAITQQPGYGAISDGVIALYTGTCGALTQINCDDDGGPNCSSGCLSPSGNNMPVISQSGLTPGSTVYIRFWAYSTASAGGNFGICVTTSDNDDCSTSLYICDLNGYKGTTGPLYTADRPSNMSGTSNGTVYAAEPNGYVSSSDLGGPFGLNSCDTGDYRRVTIDNNSWLTFTASGTTASLDVTVGDCYRNRGVQFQVFKVSAPCTNFDTVSGILQNYYVSTDGAKPYCTALATGTFISTFTVVCRNLTPGQKYYLMVDGFGGDICNYSISAKSGVQASPVINQIPNSSLCKGDSVLLNFNKTITGAFNFYFLGPNGDTITTPGVDTFVWVNPSLTSDYGLVIESVCGNKQSTTRTVTVYNDLDGGQVAFSGTTKSISICSGADPANILGSTTAMAVAPSGGDGNWTYQWQYRDNCTGPWNNIASTNSLSYNPPSGLTVPRCYRRVATNGCGMVISDSVMVNINENPTVDMDYKEVCAGSTISLSPTDTSYGSSSSFITTQITGSDLSPVTNAGSYSPSFNSNNALTYTYTYTVIDGNNCTASDTFSVKVNSNPTLSISPANAEICEGGSIALSTTTSLGSSPYNYTWSGDSVYLDNTTIDNPTFSNASANTYNLILSVTDNKGCINQVNKTIVVNPNPTLTFSGLPAVVCAGTDYNISSSIINNTGSVTYSWSGQTTGLSSTSINNPTYNNNTDGTYNLTLWASDTKTCADSEQINITVNALPVLNDTTITHLTYCGTNDGSILINATGNGPFTYSIDGGNTYQNDSNFTGLTNNNYNIIIQDANGCESNGNSITINNGGAPSKPSVSSASNTICEGSANPAFNATGSGIGTLNWYNTFPGSVIQTGNNYTPTVTNPGAYNYYVVEDVNGCASDTATVTLSINTGAQLTLTATDTSLCEGSSFNLTADVSTGSATSVTWSSATGGSFTNATQLNTAYQPSTTDINNGSIVISAITNDPSGPCVAISKNISLTILAAPVKPNLSASAGTVCEGDAATITVLNAQANTSYDVFIDTLSSSIGIANPAFSFTATNDTIFYILATNNNGCSNLGGYSNSSINVNAAPQNPIFSDNDTSICEGTTITVNAPSFPANVTYQIYNNASANPPAIGVLDYTIYNISNSSTLYIQAEQNYGGQICKSLDPLTSYQINVISAPVHPILTASNDTICEGSNTTITASPIGNTYLLYNSSNTLIDTLDATVNPTSTQTYYVETFNSAQCRALGSRDSITITVNTAPANPSFSTNSNTICYGDTAYLIISNSVSGETYPVYSLPGNNLVGNAPINVSPNSTTNYIVESISSAGCKNLGGYDTTTVNVNPLPAAPAISASPNDTVCAGTAVNILANGLQSGEYVLLFDQLTGGNMIDTLDYSFTANNTVTFYAITENNFACRNSGGKTPVTITVNPLPSDPTVTSIPDYICEETTATISANATPSNATISWWDSNGLGALLLDTGNTYTTQVLSSTTTYYMLAVSAEGCTNVNGYIPVTVNVRPRPVVTLTNDAVLGYAYQGQLIAFTAEPYGYPTYVFYVNNNQVQNSSSNVYQTNTLNNLDVVSVSAIENGCESIDKAEIKMEIKPLSNAFTPNNDGTNDIFLKGLDLQILNRWGQELYKGIDGWDGTYQGKVVSPGTYFYIVTIKDVAGNETKLNGAVTLIGE